MPPKNAFEKRNPIGGENFKKTTNLIEKYQKTTKKKF